MLKMMKMKEKKKKKKKKKMMMMMMIVNLCWMVYCCGTFLHFKTRRPVNFKTCSAASKRLRKCTRLVPHEQLWLEMFFFFNALNSH